MGEESVHVHVVSCRRGTDGSKSMYNCLILAKRYSPLLSWRKEKRKTMVVLYLLRDNIHCMRWITLVICFIVYF
jgi:hypothetical protein